MTEALAKTNAVKARIDGKDHVFCIAADAVSALEEACGEPLFAMYQRIVGGAWRIADIRKVLYAASQANQAPAKLASVEATRLRLQFATTGGFALPARPPGQYAPLAAMVLEAALFGVPESEAVFSDEAA